MDNAKLEYTTPSLVDYGQIEEVTRGSRSYLADGLFGLNGDGGIIGPPMDHGSN